MLLQMGTVKAYPCYVLGKSSAYDWTQNSSNSVHATEKAKPLSSQPQRNHITNNYLSHDDYPTASCALDTSADEDGQKVFCKDTPKAPCQKEQDRSS